MQNEQTESGDLRTVLAAGIERLRSSGNENPRLDAEVLLCELLGFTDRSALIQREALLLSGKQLSDFHAAIARRARNEPLAYILGYREFCAHRFEVNRHVLIPRPETELIVEAVVRDFPDCRNFDNTAPSLRVLDMCCGSGCLGISVAREYERLDLVLADKSPEALAVCRRNAQTILEKNTRWWTVQGDLFQALRNLPDQQPFDVIVANPPYIHPDESAALQPDVRYFEPAMALFCDPAGDLLVRLIAEAAAHLRSGGCLYMEIADRWAAQVLSAARSHYKLSELRTDYAGQVRFLHARR